MSEEKKLEEKVKDLQKAVEALIELETKRAEKELAKEKKPVEPKEQISKEELEAELKEIHLGELVRYALKKDLIRRGTSKTADDEE